MRIIAGRFRGSILASPGRGDASASLRPTSDRVRESLFSTLTHRGVIEGARVLDVFAGTGALGLEALSRGAREVCFVEHGRVALRLLAKNQQRLRVEKQTFVMRSDARRLGTWSNAPFDLVFLDPPYGRDLGQIALQRLRDGGWLSPCAFVAWEENAPMTPPDGFECIETRRFGSTHVTLMTA
ncbi:MAG: 16S rRNA (guanine(966)-N(2))-methyltransferase RsmD [Pseudomonadota bacterium]